MGREASLFETSEMLGNFLASTPLLSQSWNLCNLANTNYPHSFVTQQIGTSGYVAFSGVQSVYGPDTCGGNQMVPLDGSLCSGFFSSLCNQNIEEQEDADDDSTVLVHGGFLQIFLSILANSGLKDQIMAMKDKCKSIVITGHSIGGTTASLCALWLLSYLQPISSTCSVLCITFGSAFLGNQSLSRAILRERWGGNFCHVVSKHDLMPRLLFNHLPCFNQKLHDLLNFWHFSMTSSGFKWSALQLDRAIKAEIFTFVLSSLQESVQANGDVKVQRFSPFGNYLFFSEDGAICLNNSTSIIKMMYLLFASGSPISSIEDHLNYGDYVDRVSSQFQMQRNSIRAGIPEKSFDAGITLALQSSGMTFQEPIRRSAEDCIKLSRRIGRSPSLNSADLAIKLSKITPYRAEIEWYKATCDQSQVGYYDSFKGRGASKRDLKVNMNRYKLARFWDNVIKMMETNQLPYDFHKQEKWVNASQFYMLLVEPLDIAEYYRRNWHREKGHYRHHGRERRYQIFDKWWKQRKHRVDNKVRSKFASQTQDTCFWARVEEARDALDNVQKETDQRRRDVLWQELHEFYRYASELIERKEVSEDVLAKNSSYSLWVREYRDLKSQVQRIPPQFPVLIDALEEMVP